MPKRSNEFQKLIYVIHQQVSTEARVTESMMMADSATGEEREVDIVIETQAGNKSLIMGIECCDRSRKADVGWVEQMWAKHQDLPTDRLVLVARAGYTRSARRKATAHAIEIVDVSDAILADWSKIIKLWKELFVVGVTIQWSYRVIGLTEEQQEIEISIIGNEIFTDRETKISFSINELIYQLHELHRVEEIITDQTSIDHKQFYIVTFDAPINRYFTIVGGKRILLKKIDTLARVYKSGFQIPLRHGTLGSIQYAYGKGSAFNGSFIVSLTEQTDNGVQASLQYRTTQGREQTIKLMPSDALVKKMDELRQQD